LFLDAVSEEYDLLRCKNVNCYSYFRNNNKKEIEELGSFTMDEEDMKKRGLECWPGVPTSISYKPRWVTRIEFILKT
jgi:hypothetical protein